MKKDQTKKLTPMMLATALATVSSTAVAYNHDMQSSILKSGADSKSPYEVMQDTTHTQTINPKTGMIYNDND